ncbi:MAG TPA: right-handed parallel beta-helix repeat-containing protein [Baekduia sp.]
MAYLRGIKVRLAMVVAVALAGVATLALRDVPDNEARAAGSIFVDAGGHGATCSDSRSAADAQNQATPVCTIGRGITLAGAAGSVTVRGGSYPALTVQGGARTGYVTVAAAAGEAVTVPTISLTGSASWLKFQGFTLSGGSGSPFSIAPGSSAHLALVGSSVSNSGGADLAEIGAGTSDVLFDGDSFTGGGEGIAWAADTSTPKITNVTVRNSHFKNIGTDALRPANFDTVVVDGNTIEGLAENGDHSDALQSYAGGAHLTFRNNYVHDNASEGFFIKDGHVDDVSVINNVFVHNTGAASPLKMYDTTGIQIINNTVWDNEANPVLSSGLSNVTIRNNIIERLDSDATVANVTEDHNVLGGTYGWTAAATDLRGTPKFVNAAAGDYRLAAGSLGIDVGNAAGAPAADKACRARYDDPATANRGTGSPAYVDAGALEFGPGTSAADVSAGADCAAGTLPGGGGGGTTTPTTTGTTTTTTTGGGAGSATCTCQESGSSGKAAGAAASAKGGGSSGPLAAAAVAPCAKRSTRGKAGKLTLRSPSMSKGRLLVTVSATKACRLALSGSATWTWAGQRKRAKLTSGVRSLDPGKARRVRIALPKSARRALLANKRIELRMTIRTTAADGVRRYFRVIHVRR